VTPARTAKALAAGGLVALFVCAPALAKFRIAIAASDATPAVGQRVALTVRSELPLDHDLRLIAVAPGEPVFRVVATITGDTSRPLADVARRGFEVELTRVSGTRWSAVAHFRRAGRWRLVVPNWAPVGVVLPNGAATRTVVVR
jgi:hypothetical protein